MNSSIIRYLCDAYDEAKLALPTESNITMSIGHILVKAVAQLVQDTKHMTYDEIEVAKTQGKIPAIKMVRERAQIGLKDAKDLVEAEASRLGFGFYQRTW